VSKYLNLEIFEVFMGSTALLRCRHENLSQPAHFNVSLKESHTFTKSPIIRVVIYLGGEMNNSQ